jgi:o-succinylbenzoate synthase
MRIDYHLYVLQFKENYGALGGNSAREGALLRVTFKDGLIGYCDCHPWEELGDLALLGQLAMISRCETTPLLDCSLRFARIDAEARQNRRSLFDGLEIPPSHRLVSLKESLHPLYSEGIRHCKVKVGSDPDREIAVMNSWMSSYPEFYLRLDFNQKLSRGGFHSYWNSLPHSLQQRIDFVEDPYPYSTPEWINDQLQLGVCFAADRCAMEALPFPESAWVHVHKPAVELIPQLLNRNSCLVVTTYLDHPLGQMCAAYTAALLKIQYPQQIRHCGLLTHHCYRDDPFIQSVKSIGHHLKPSNGWGFGFDKLLKEIEWQSL